MTLVNPEDLGTTERVTMEILALANETANRIHPCVTMLRQYKRGYPTGGDATGDGTSRTEALGISPPDIIDREQRELTRCLDTALRAMQVAYNITARYALASKPHRPEPVSDDDGWCISCLRNDNHMEPVWAGRYARLCRWCGEFYASEGVDPPLVLLKARHAGRRITTHMVDQALAKNRHGGRKTA